MRKSARHQRGGSTKKVNIHASLMADLLVVPTEMEKCCSYRPALSPVVIV